jgi:hypothetical protein
VRSEDRVGKVRAGEVRAGEVCAVEARADEVHLGEVSAGEVNALDVALRISAPDHSRCRLDVWPHHSFLFWRIAGRRG